MKYQHHDGEAAPSVVSLTAVRDKARVGADGVFTVDEERPDFEDVHERLVAAGHDPLHAGDDDTDGPQAEDAATDGDEDPTDQARASDWTEEELVAMGRQELRAIAAHYDDVDGNASGDELTEALIKKRREETEAD